jgi:hypothetical protein
MAFPVGNTVLPGYPMPLGEKYLVIFDHTGPKSYTQLSAGAGGDIINAADLGMDGFDAILETTLDTTVTYSVEEVYTLGGYGNAVPSINLEWFTSPAQTTQVTGGTDLSSKSVRITAVMV